MELTFNLTEDRREPLKPQSLKDFELTFGNGSGVNVQSNNWVQGRLQMDNLRQTFVNIQQGKDNEPFDITGYILQFCGRTPFDGKQQSYRVIDNSSVVVDGLHGRFRYTFPAQAFAVAGTYKQAYFRLIRLSDYKCIATLEFDLSVLEDFVFADMVPSDYISPFNDILNQLLDGEKKFKADTQTLYEEAAKRLNDAITQLTQLGTDVKTTLTTEKTALQQLIEKIKENNLFTQAEADAFKQAIQKSIVITFDTVKEMKQATVTVGQYIATRGYYVVGDGGNAHYLVTDKKPNNGWNESLQNGLYAKLVLPTTINPAQFGAHFNGIDSDADAIQNAVNLGNTILPANSTVVVDKPIELPQQNRTIDFNGSEVLIKGGTLIKVGSLTEKILNHTYVIRNAKLKFDSITAAASAFDITDVYDIRFEKISVNTVVDNLTLFGLTDCFNATFDNCFGGSGTGSYVNTAGIKLRLIKNHSGQIPPDNATNVKITNCLMQNMSTGFDIDGSDCLVDTLTIDNCGTSECVTGYSITGGAEEVMVQGCRAENSVDSNFYLNTVATISNFHSYSNGNTKTGIKIDSKARAVMVGTISVDGSYKENAIDSVGRVNARGASFNVFDGQNTNIQNMIFPWRSDPLTASLTQLDSLRRFENRIIICVDKTFDIASLPTGVADGLELVIIMRDTDSVYRVIYHNGWRLQDNHLVSLDLEHYVNLSGYTSSSNTYTCPCDGYVKLRSDDDSDVWQLNTGNQILLRAKNSVVTLLLKREMSVYLSSTGKTGSATFYPTIMR